MPIDHVRFSLASSGHSKDHSMIVTNITNGDMTSNQQSHSIWSEALSLKLGRARMRGWILFLGCLTILAACGCASSGKSSQADTPLAGNWQFTMSAPSDASFGGTSPP